MSVVEPDVDPPGAEPARRPAVMTDVARLAGVSHMTVSRVINDHPAVSSSTRNRVLAAMAKLAYRPNIAARTLVTGRTRRIGVISVEPTLYGPASMLVAIERAARDAEYAVSIASLAALDRRALGDAVDFLTSQAVEGIIAITPHTATMAALRYVPSGVPIVAVEGGKAAVPTVAVDQYLGAVLATRHLLGLGHSTVVHISGPGDWYEATERERGWRDALLAEGRDVPEVVMGDWSARSGHEAARRLIGTPGLSALFVANDQMALGVLRALHEAQVSVPDEISVVGFDDHPESAYFTPPLTTVRQDFGEVGRQGLDLLLVQVEGAPRSRRRRVIPPELVIRNSTTGPPAR